MGFEETIVHCGAPALCGIKPACLFSMAGENYYSGLEKLRLWQGDFSRRSVFFVPLKKEEGRFLFFVYDRILLERLCRNPENAEYLLSKGYPVQKGFGAVLSHLLHRLALSAEFPHEVGLFLGYPLEDVSGFELYGARNCKYSGFWKVYGNKEKALRLMKKYKTCTDICMKLLAGGLSVPLVARRYKNSNTGEIV